MNYIDRLYIIRQNQKIQHTQFVNEAAEELVCYLEKHNTPGNICRTATITRSTEELKTFNLLCGVDENSPLDGAVVELSLCINAMLKNGESFYPDSGLDIINVSGTLEDDTGIFTLRI